MKTEHLHIFIFHWSDFDDYRSMEAAHVVKLICVRGLVAGFVVWSWGQEPGGAQGRPAKARPPEKGTINPKGFALSAARTGGGREIESGSRTAGCGAGKRNGHNQSPCEGPCFWGMSIFLPGFSCNELELSVQLFRRSLLSGRFLALESEF
jgi:hypothetical protein